MKRLTLLFTLCLVSATMTFGQDADTRAQVLNDYLAAWSEPNDDKRMEFLAASFAESGEYSDPVSITRTRAELSQLIGMYQNGPTEGAYLRLLDKPQYHNGIYGQFDWVMMLPNHEVLLVGQDFVTFNEEGLIEKITGFFDPTKLQ